MKNNLSPKYDYEHDYDVVILGAGASGLMCGLTVAQKGLSCVIIDHSPTIARKLCIAGGGKGNITNLNLSPKWYVGENPIFCKDVLLQYSPHNIIDLLKKYNIPWEIRTHDQVFCKVKVSHFVKCLIDECKKNNVQFLLKNSIQKVSANPKSFIIKTSTQLLKTSNLVLALGSQAWPATGATDLGIHIATQCRHTIIPTRPILVPFILQKNSPLQGLAGISLNVSITVGTDNKKRTFHYPLLFTHKGISGPAALQASCFWKKGQTITINFLPHISLIDYMHSCSNTKQTVKNLLKNFFPIRFIDNFIPIDLQSRKIAEISKKNRIWLSNKLHAYVEIPLETEGIKKAEAMAGGVNTYEVNPHTLESNIVPGLYFSGELLDITGLLGGYNLHWAWASGYVVGKTIQR